MIVVGNASVQHVRVEGGAAGHIQQQVVAVRDRTQIVQVNNSVYSYTNFFIRQTREYIPSRQLKEFTNFRGFGIVMTAALLIQCATLIVVSVILAQTEPNYANTILTLVLSCLTLSSCVPFLLIFCQHLNVIHHTLPWVLRQPVIPNMVCENKHLEVAVTSLEGVYLSARNSGIGLVSQRTGTIRFHVLSSLAVRIILGAKFVSISCTVVEIIFLIWSAITGIVSCVCLITLLVTD